MNRIAQFATALLAATALAACAPGINEGFGHRITFDANGMVVHATGHPNAHVGRDGSLRIGDTPVATTDAQRQLLQQYYRQADALLDSGKAIGAQGAKLGLHAAGTAIDSILHGDSSAAEKQLDAQTAGIEGAANALCKDLAVLGATQKTIAAQLPAFAPYASGSRTRCDITTRQRGSGDNGAATSASYQARGNARAKPSTPWSASTRMAYHAQPIRLGSQRA